MEFKFKDEKKLEQRLEELHKDVSRKQKFEDAVAALNSLLRDHYSAASPSLRKLYYGVVCRVATVLKTRYTSLGFWAAGLALFQLAHSLVSDPSEKAHLLACIDEARHVVHQENDPPQSSSSPNQGYLFEGHLTVDREPPQPQWLVQSNLLTAAMAAGSSSESGPGNEENSESAVNLLQSLIDNLDSVLPPGVLDDVRAAPRVPPASKQVVANLPVITITEEVLEKLGGDTDCCICKENLVVNDKMQELPCKHTFHPPCLKPWLDEHNSCPICRHELQTDDHAYESWKEREKEAEEDRKGAANAIRGGEYIVSRDVPPSVPDTQNNLSYKTKFNIRSIQNSTLAQKSFPYENRDFCKSSYNVKRTLLVKFNFEAVDETDTLEEMLNPRVEYIGGTLENVEISGDHITPYIQEPKWQAGYLYAPADAVVQNLKTLSLYDVRVLSRTISDRFKGFED